MSGQRPLGTNCDRKWSPRDRNSVARSPEISCHFFREGTTGFPSNYQPVNILGDVALDGNLGRWTAEHGRFSGCVRGAVSPSLRRLQKRSKGVFGGSITPRGDLATFGGIHM
jgi:hypothetical protein